MRNSWFFVAPLVNILLRVELDSDKWILPGLNAGDILQPLPVVVPGQSLPKPSHSKPVIIKVSMTELSKESRSSTWWSWPEWGNARGNWSWSSPPWSPASRPGAPGHTIYINDKLVQSRSDELVMVFARYPHISGIPIWHEYYAAMRIKIHLGNSPYYHEHEHVNADFKLVLK